MIFAKYLSLVSVILSTVNAQNCENDQICVKKVDCLDVKEDDFTPTVNWRPR